MIKVSEKENLVHLKKGEQINIRTSQKTDIFTVGIGSNKEGKLFLEYLNEKHPIDYIYGLIKDDEKNRMRMIKK